MILDINLSEKKSNTQKKMTTLFDICNFSVFYIFQKNIFAFLWTPLLPCK